MAVDRREAALPTAAPGGRGGRRRRGGERRRARSHRRASGRTPGTATSGTRRRSSRRSSSSSWCLYCLLIPGFWKIPGIWTIAQGLRPERGRLLAVLRRLQPRPSVLDRQVRPRPLRTHGGRRPDLDRDRLRRDLRHPRDRRRLRLDLGLRRREARQRDDALPRRALRAALPAVRDHHDSPIIGTQNFWTMVVALTIASWFTAARDRARPGDHAEGERLRARGEGGRRALVPDSRPAPAAEHARRPRSSPIFLELPGVVLGEAFLSFIGLGINPPTASWGSMAQDGREAYRLHPEVLFIPSLAIATLVMCANFIADGLRDALDPRTRETG